MMKFRIITFFVLIITLGSFDLKMKVSFIYIKEELKIAKSIQEIIIFEYTDSTMLYTLTNSKDTLVVKSRRGKFLNLRDAKKINDFSDSKKEFGGNWPAIGQRVLAVIDTTFSVRLFAFKIVDQYRFWDPNSIPFANSIFLIPKEKSFQHLPNCIQYLDDKSDFWNCSDGCLVNINAVKLRN